MILCVGLSPALGRVITLPSLSPGEVNRAAAYLEVAAGKATNAARVIVQSGGRARVISPLGAEHAAYYRQLAAKDGIDLAAVEYAGRIRWAMTLVDSQHGATEVVCNEPEPVPEHVGEEIGSTFRRWVSGASACVIAGSRLDNMPTETITGIVATAVAHHVPLFLDIRGNDLVAALAARNQRSAEPGLAVPVTIKINEEEFWATIQPSKVADAAGTGHVDDAVSRFAREYQVTVVVTRGTQPVVYADPSGIVGATEVPVVKTVNPIGSGDTFLGTLAVRMEAGDDLATAVRAATAAASLNAGFLRPGTIQAP